MSAKLEAMAKARAAYHAAADTYDHPALSFWERFGRETVARLRLRPDEHVLDVCCGSGASAIPAAEAVGRNGRVVGIDLAPGLIELARRKANIAGLAHAEFLEGDFEQLAEPEAAFDAVVCVFGIFFLPDMPAALRRLWRWVRPGGRLAVTTWGPRLFEPANTIFWDTIRTVRPELYKGFNPWDRISDPAAVVALMAEAGIVPAAANAASADHRLREPDDWWWILKGSGYRGIIDALTPAQHVTVRDTVVETVRARGIDRIETNVIFATAIKP